MTEVLAHAQILGVERGDFRSGLGSIFAGSGGQMAPYLDADRIRAGSGWISPDTQRRQACATRGQ